jgi:arylsulfatase A-like enzyme
VLRGAGYRTLLVGKYLNGYPGSSFDYVPPGWNRWFATTGVYYDYYAANNGHRSRLYGSEPEDYSGRVLTERAIRYVEGSLAIGTPFFLYFAPSQPHGSGAASDPDASHDPLPDPDDVGSLDGIDPWRPATFGNRDDVSDMPGFVRKITWTRDSREEIDRFRQRQLEALRSLDREIGELLAAAPVDTLVILTSDNGFLWGEHRLGGKNVPYEESIRVPLVTSWVGHTTGSIDDRLALNIDIAPTVATAAGIDPSITPLGTDSDGEPTLTEGLDLLGSETRAAFPLEHMRGTVPAYCGVRTLDGWMYVRYANAFEEMYHVAVDPLEQTNLALSPALATQRRALRAKAVALCNPPPPDYSWWT